MWTSSEITTSALAKQRTTIKITEEQYLANVTQRQTKPSAKRRYSTLNVITQRQMFTQRQTLLLSAKRAHSAPYLRTY